LYLPAYGYIRKFPRCTSLGAALVRRLVRNASFRWIGSVLFCFSLVILSATAFANDYYVMATGSDSNDGSQARPWKTIQHCVSSFSLGSNGAVCHVGAGSYSTGVDVNRGGSSQSVRFALQCDSGAASASAAANECKITGTISFANIGVFVETNNVDVIGFDVGNNANMGAGIGISGQTPAANSVHLKGNYVHDLGQNVFNFAGTVGPGCPESGAITGGNGASTDLEAIGNFVKNFGVTPALTGCSVSQGIYFAGTNEVYENNIVVKVPTAGIQVQSNQKAIVSNNTVINSRECIIVESVTGTPGLSTYANNYCADYTVGAFFFASNVAKCSASNPNLFSHNMTDGSLPVFTSGPFSCDQVVNAPMPVQAGASFFTNYQLDGSGDYHLKGGSLGIGAGSTACVQGGTFPCTPTLDMAGVSRSVSLSLGAFESGQSASMPAAPSGLTALVQ
jgi:hypothetical protein